jgi:hypothetical protein
MAPIYIRTRASKATSFEIITSPFPAEERDAEHLILGSCDWCWLGGEGEKGKEGECLQLALVSISLEPVAVADSSRRDA